MYQKFFCWFDRFCLGFALKSLYNNHYFFTLYWICTIIRKCIFLRNILTTFFFSNWINIITVIIFCQSQVFAFKFIFIFIFKLRLVALLVILGLSVIGFILLYSFFVWINNSFNWLIVFSWYALIMFNLFEFSFIVFAFVFMLALLILILSLLANSL